MSDDEIERELHQMMRLLLTSGGQAAEMLARNRQRRVQDKISQERERIAHIERVERAGAEANRQALQQRRDGLRAGWEPAMWGDWRDEASLSDWATAYTHARTARDERIDPEAARAADLIRDEAARRYGVDLAREYARMQGAGADESDAAVLESAEQRHADADRVEVPEPEVLTDEQFQRRHRDRYAGTQGDWIDRASAEDFVDAYATAREMEAHDPVARLAAKNLEDKMAARNPGRYPGGAQDFRQHWDQLLDAQDRGARPQGPRPDERLGPDRALDHEARRDRARGEEGNAHGREQHHRAEVDRLTETTSAMNGTDVEVARGRRTVELSAPAHRELRASPDHAAKSSKPKARPVRDQTKPRKLGK